MTTHYYQVAACLWSYHALVFVWLVGIGCFACGSGLVHLCWCVHTCGIVHALDPLLYQLPSIALMSWSVCYLQACWAYLLVVLCCIYTAFYSLGQPLGGVRAWSHWWLAFGFMAAQFIQYPPCHLEFAEYWCSCKGQWWYVALLFGAALWCRSCLVHFLGSRAFIYPACIWVDAWVVTQPAHLCGPQVLVCCCSFWGQLTRFCCTQGPQCPTVILLPPKSALFGAFSDSTWWWTSLAFVAGDALHTWWALEYPQDFVFSASPCLVARLVAWGLCICTWVLGLPVAEGLDLWPCWFVVSNWYPSWVFFGLVHGLHYRPTTQQVIQ